MNTWIRTLTTFQCIFGTLHNSHTFLCPPLTLASWGGNKVWQLYYSVAWMLNEQHQWSHKRLRPFICQIVPRVTLLKEFKQWSLEISMIIVIRCICETADLHVMITTTTRMLVSQLWIDKILHKLQPRAFCSCSIMRSFRIRYFFFSQTQ